MVEKLKEYIKEQLSVIDFINIEFKEKPDESGTMLWRAGIVPKNQEEYNIYGIDVSDEICKRVASEITKEIVSDIHNRILKEATLINDIDNLDDVYLDILRTEFEPPYNRISTVTNILAELYVKPYVIMGPMTDDIFFNMLATDIKFKFPVVNDALVYLSNEKLEDEDKKYLVKIVHSDNRKINITVNGIFVDDFDFPKHTTKRYRTYYDINDMSLVKLRLYLIKQ